MAKTLWSFGRSECKRVKGKKIYRQINSQINKVIEENIHTFSVLFV